MQHQQQQLQHYKPTDALTVSWLYRKLLLSTKLNETKAKIEDEKNGNKWGNTIFFFLSFQVSFWTKIKNQKQKYTKAL